MGNSSLAYGASTPDLAPGVPDPIQEPVLRPPLLDWPCRPEVRDKHVRALQTLLTGSCPMPLKSEGWGIVTCGGGIYWPGIVVSARMLRLVSSLPMQIWYRGEEERVCKEDVQDLGNVTLIDAREFFREKPRILGGWQLKTLALMNCGFERAVFLDGDAYLTRSPEELLAQLDRERIIYWQDVDEQWQNITWHWWGLDAGVGGKPPPIQGGQLWIDLLKLRREMLLWHFCCQHSDYFFHFPANRKADWHGYGDQDSLRGSLFLTRGAHCSLGKATIIEEGLRCDLAGENHVIHRCRRKLLVNGEVEPPGNLPGDNRVHAIIKEHLAMRERPELLFWGLFKDGSWGKKNSCGAGSYGEEAKAYLDLVNQLIASQNWTSVVDLGCGDGNVALGLKCNSLTGVDVAAGHIARLKREHPEHTWLCGDVYSERSTLPCGDVALMKDVLHHWPNSQVVEFIRWAAHCGKWRAVVYTQDCNQGAGGCDCALGGYRALEPGVGPLAPLNLFQLGRFNHKALLLQTCAPLPVREESVSAYETVSLDP